MVSITELTEKYILEHESIKNCLKKGLINYSALARLVAKECGIEKRASNESILVAARRFREKINGGSLEDEIIHLFRKSNIEIKNNVVIYTLEKYIYPGSLIDVEKKIKVENSLFFSIEGTKTITIIVQRQNCGLVEKNFMGHVLSKKENLSLITITSPGIESTPGAVSYISGLFFENGINIEEFMSCHDDTLIVIESMNLDKVVGSFNF